MKNERSVKFELLRIVSILIVVYSHLVSNSGIYDNVSRISDVFSASFFIQGGKLGVNLFALITGYCGYNSKFRINKVITIVVTVVSYSYIALILTALLLPSFLSLDLILDFIFPIGRGTYWYISAYIIFMFLKPIIDVFLQRLTDGELKKIIICFTVLLSVAPTFCIYANANVTNNIWIAYMYILGVYMRRRKIDNELLSKGKSLLFFFIFYFGICFSQVVLKCCGMPFLNTHSQYFLAMNTIPMLLSSVFLFVYFIELDDIKNKGMQQLGKLGKYSFDIYILHSGIFVKTLLYGVDDVIDKLSTRGRYCWVRFLILGIIVYSICLIIGIMFQALLKRFLKIEFIARLINRMEDWFAFLNQAR